MIRLGQAESLNSSSLERWGPIEQAPRKSCVPKNYQEAAASAQSPGLYIFLQQKLKGQSHPPSIKKTRLQTLEPGLELGLTLFSLVLLSVTLKLFPRYQASMCLD